MASSTVLMCDYFDFASLGDRCVNCKKKKPPVGFAAQKCVIPNKNQRKRQIRKTKKKKKEKEQSKYILEEKIRKECRRVKDGISRFESVQCFVEDEMYGPHFCALLRDEKQKQEQQKKVHENQVSEMGDLMKTFNVMFDCASANIYI